MKFSLSIDGEKREFDVSEYDGTAEFRSGDTVRAFNIRRIFGRNMLIIDENNRVYDVFVDRFEDGHCVFFRGRSFKIKDATARKSGSGLNLDGEVTVKSPLPGQIKKVFKKLNEDVEAGESVLVLEAMKMENEIKSPKKGRIKELRVEEGKPVDPQAVLFIVE